MFLVMRRMTVMPFRSDANRQQYIDKFKLLGMDKYPYKILRIKWMDNSVALQLASTTRP